MSIETKELCKSFKKGEQEIQVVRDLNFTVSAGESVSILGASGAGKSTLLNLIGGLDRPSSGSVVIGSEPINEKSDINLAEFRNTNIGFVFQFHHLLKDFNATENVAMPLLIRGVNKSKATKVAVDLLGEVGLRNRIEHKPGELSGGEQQRVAISRAMITEPAVILADEPTGNLDRNSGEQILELLFGMNSSRGCTLIVVTHNEDFAKRAQRTVWMVDGKINENNPNN